MEEVTGLTILLLTVFCVVLFLVAAYRCLVGRRPELGAEKKLPRLLLLFGLGVIGAIAIAIVLPVADSTRDRAVALIGLLISVTLARSNLGRAILGALRANQIEITAPAAIEFHPPATNPPPASRASKPPELATSSDAPRRQPPSVAPRKAPNRYGCDRVGILLASRSRAILQPERWPSGRRQRSRDPFGVARVL